MRFILQSLKLQLLTYDVPVGMCEIKSFPLLKVRKNILLWEKKSKNVERFNSENTDVSGFTLKMFY